MKINYLSIVRVLSEACFLVVPLLAANVAHSYEICDSNLLESIRSNHLDKFTEALAKGANVNCSTGGQFDSSPLSSAVGFKRNDMVKTLLSKGAAVNAQNREGFTPLMNAPVDDGMAMINILLSHKADPNIKTKDGFNFLSALVNRGEFEACTYLLEHGGNPKIIDGNGDTLAQAAWKHVQWVLYDEERVIAFISYLMKKGVDLTVENEDGKTIADLAFSSCHIELLKLVDVSRKYSDALASIKPITVEEKLRRAIDRKDVSAVRKQLAQRPDLSYLDPIFKTPALIHAVTDKNSDIVKLILDAGSPVDIKDGYGRTALDVAAYQKNDEIIKLLREANAKPTGTALISAVQGGSLDTVKGLIEKGMDINTRGQGNYTALMAAVKNQKPEIVDYLLARGADSAIKNAQGKTAADIAAEVLDLNILKKVDRNGAYKDFLSAYTPKRDSPFLGSWAINRSGSWGDFGITLKNDGTAVFANMLGAIPAVWKEHGTEMELTAFFEKKKIVLKGNLVAAQAAAGRPEDGLRHSAKESTVDVAETILSQTGNNKYALKAAWVKPPEKPAIQKNGKDITVEQVKKNNLSIDDLIWIIESNNWDLKKHIPWDKLPTATLEQLAVKFVNYREPNITIAAQANCNEKTLDILSNANDIEAKKNVAKHKNTSQAVLMKLTARDQAFEVRLAAALNPKMPLERYLQILEEGSKSLKKEKRRIVARDPRSTSEILDRLSLDVDDDVKTEVARNKNTPNAVIEKMVDNADIRLRSDLAYNPNCSAQLLDSLSKDKEEQVRRAVAFNENVPESILERLANDPHSAVRSAVVENKRTPEHILQLLLNDSYNGIQDNAKRKLIEMHKTKK